MPPSTCRRTGCRHPAPPAPPSPSARRRRNRRRFACRSRVRVRAACRRRGYCPAGRHRAHAASPECCHAFRARRFRADRRRRRRAGRRASIACVASSAQPRRAISCCASPTFMFEGTATSIIFGLGRFQVVHQCDVVVHRFHLEARIVTLLLADGGDRVAFVVVRGKHHRLVRQSQKFAEDRLVLRACVAVLEIGAAGAADEQRVAGEHAVAHEETVGIVGMAGRVEHVDARRPRW